MTIAVVLFDLDGTLIDSIPLIVDSFRYTYTLHLGFSPPDDLLVQGIGTPLRAQLARYSQDPALVEAMFRTYRAHNRQHHDASIRAFPAVNETVALLHAAGLPLGVVTSKARETALHGLEIGALAQYFATVVALEDAVRHKPDPTPVLVALERLGFAQEHAGTAVFVGDSPHDLHAGRAAGTRTAAVAWGPFARADLQACEPDFFFERPMDMVAAFTAGTGETGWPGRS